MIRVMVVDDHDVVRKGLISFLETEETIEVIGEASGGHEAVEKAKTLKPDIILMDLMMENGNGVEATQAIKQAEIDSKIIILTSFYDDSQVFPALEAGAFSYMLKTSSANEIVQTIEKAVEGKSVLEDKVQQKVLQNFRGNDVLLHDQLTERENEVLRLIANGFTNQEIADQLYIGIKTVKTHVSHILSKLEVNDRTQAAVYAHKQKLI